MLLGQSGGQRNGRSLEPIWAGAHDTVHFSRMEIEGDAGASSGFDPVAALFVDTVESRLFNPSSKQMDRFQIIARPRKAGFRRLLLTGTFKL